MTSEINYKVTCNDVADYEKNSWNCEWDDCACHGFLIIVCWLFVLKDCQEVHCKEWNTENNYSNEES